MEVCMYVQGVHCLGEKLKVGSRSIYKSTSNEIVE